MSDLIDRQAVLALPRSITRNMRGKVVEESVDVEMIKALPPAPAIPLAWIDSYIKTCEMFDLRANVPAEKIIKTMVKIWEQGTQGKKKGGDNGKT